MQNLAFEALWFQNEATYRLSFSSFKGSMMAVFHPQISLSQLPRFLVMIILGLFRRGGHSHLLIHSLTQTDTYLENLNA